MAMEVITHEEFLARLKAQGVPREHLGFKCPICKSVQSAALLISVGAGKTAADVAGYEYFSCFGRWTGAGPHDRNSPPGRGCDWTLGGLFHLHELEVQTVSGERLMAFRPASPKEAKELMARLAKRPEEEFAPVAG